MISTLMKRALFIVAAILPFWGQAQNLWNKKKCAVVLTYDDALNVHLDKAIPQLDSVGFKGTFYLSAYSQGCRERIEDWKTAAKRGHELGNHTLFHPCIGNTTDRTWVTPERDLQRYTMERYIDEVRMTNVFLKSLDGKSQRTFAYTCGDTLVQGQSVVNRITKDFIAARGVKSELISLTSPNLYNTGAYGINGESAEEMISLVKEAIRTNSAIVFLFHGVGGEHALNVGASEHRKLLKFLKEHEKEIWIAPFIEMTEYMKKNQKSSGGK
jgi:peptidoglycan/xylan/chitin deacetylase (PgdA/CDA1 family)